MEHLKTTKTEADTSALIMITQIFAENAHSNHEEYDLPRNGGAKTSANDIIDISSALEKVDSICSNV